MAAKSEEIQGAESKIFGENNRLQVRQSKLEDSEIKLAEKMTVVDMSEKRLQNKLVNYEELKAQLEIDAQQMLAEGNLFKEEKRIFLLENEKLRNDTTTLVESLNLEHMQQLEQMKGDLQIE